MEFVFTAGTVDKSINVFIQDDTKNDGSGLTGLVHDTSGLVCYYSRPSSAATQLSLVTQTPTGTHTDGGFVEIDAINMPGWYRLDLSDVIIAGGVDNIGLLLKGAANMVPVPVTIQINSLQTALDSIANVGSAVHRPAADYTLITGTQSANTFAATEALDGIHHEHTDDAGALDLYYEFNIGAGIPGAVQVTGYVTGNNDDLDIYGYDWVAAGWVQIGNIQGANSTSNQVNSFNMFVNMVGSGVDNGTVRIRFFKASGLTSATLAVDQIFVAYSLGVEGYQNAAVWFDSDASNTNTVVGVDGTPRNPVSTEAAVNTLLASTNLKRVEVAVGSSVTFTTAHIAEVWNGEHWALVLGGQDVGNSHFIGADISGIGTGTSRIDLRNCGVGDVTLHQFHLDNCALVGTLTMGEPGNYVINNSHSSIAGSTTPVIDTGAAIANVNLAMPDYHNGVEIRNLNATGTDLFSISGIGQIIYAASCSGEVNQRGDWKVTNTGGVTIVADDNTAGARIIDGTTTEAQHDKLVAAATYGIGNGAGTTNMKYRNEGDTVNRIDAIVDALGNRLSVTLDKS